MADHTLTVKTAGGTLRVIRNEHGIHVKRDSTETAYALYGLTPAEARRLAKAMLASAEAGDG